MGLWPDFAGAGAVSVGAGTWGAEPGIRWPVWSHRGQQPHARGPSTTQARSVEAYGPGCTARCFPNLALRGREDGAHTFDPHRWGVRAAAVRARGHPALDR